MSPQIPLLSHDMVHLGQINRHAPPGALTFGPFKRMVPGAESMTGTLCAAHTLTTGGDIIG